MTRPSCNHEIIFSEFVLIPSFTGCIAYCVSYFQGLIIDYKVSTLRINLYLFFYYSFSFSETFPNMLRCLLAFVQRTWTQSMIEHGLWISFIGYAGFSIMLVTLSSCLVLFWAPAASGGGVCNVYSFMSLRLL